MTDLGPVAETAEVTNADTTDPDAAVSYNFSLLRIHLRDVHRNEAATGLTNEEAVDQHHHEHHGPGGLRLHDHPHLIPPTRWEHLHPPQAGAAVEGPHPDIITMDREIGRTRANVTLQSGVTVTGDWAAGDCQALRRLVGTLVGLLNDDATELHTVLRGNRNMGADNRDLRDQLVVALNEVNDLHLAREHWTDQTGRVGQLMAEVTVLQAQLAQATSAPTSTPEEAVVRDQARRLAVLTRQHDALRDACAAEKTRAETAEAKIRELTERLDTEAGWHSGARDFVWRHAVDAATAADQAVKEEAWKNAGRLLKLANMWTSLLAAADFPQAPSTEPT